MDMNRVHIQPGLSLPVFLKHYGPEVQCEQMLEVTSWSQ